MKTDALKQALSHHKFDVAFGGARRDEEKSRAKERVFSFRTRDHRWDPKNQRPELWSLYNSRKEPGESIRVFPLSNWTETDIWQYIMAEGIPIPDLYLARERPVVERDGTLIMVDDDRMPLEPGEEPAMEMVRFRTLGMLSADRGDPINRGDAARDHLGDAAVKDVGAAGPGDRQGCRRLDGRQEAGGVFLMSEQDLLKADIAGYLARQAEKDTLRFITCGSVDDGKSTLIGRLLWRSCRSLMTSLPPLTPTAANSERRTVTLILHSWWMAQAAEREQGITIDVAYRYFTQRTGGNSSSPTPGHEQYTRNMATGASTAALAIIMIDARKGVLAQTRRHAFIAALLGIRHVVLAVNKMDLVDYAEDVFDAITSDFMALNNELGFAGMTPIPISALKGDNVLAASANTPWYDGPSLLAHLEEVDVAAGDGPLRLPVQYVIRPHQDFRGYAGRIAGGGVTAGDAVKIQPSGQEARVEHVYVGEAAQDRAGMGQSVTVTLQGEFDISRGDMIVAAGETAEIADQFEPPLSGWTRAKCCRGAHIF